VQGVEAMMAMPGFVRPDACQGSAGP